ncbi:HEXXH motif-containing putative peptide modification protein [Aurantimonas sp. 22II-16-19i]|uniref:aKG-HExxH-type peptide beta-hydroxylase n=1 Tax=Aurantimonas sp. 22II-16-19i TaxID=1317114 RepID=UPI0009F7F359|nr:HEXXH motif-containing putative peptide modification protein [Aurantimonas sp. 22II-16-19i]ORE91161.1 hypothetical protein ATO4_19734 [Aurantimonas sp. 22II-16-19i]
MMIYPDPDGALRLTRNIHEKLAESLEDIAKAVSKAGILSHKALTVAQSVRQLQPISPDYFARYFEILEAVERDDITASVQLLEELSGTVERDIAGNPPASGRLKPARAVQISTWAELDVGQRARYARYFESNTQGPLSLGMPESEAAETLRQEIVRAFERLDLHLPDLAAELRNLVTQIVICSAGDRNPSFAGASTFYIWGAIFMNPAAYGQGLEVVEGLVVESTHALLYGLSQGNSLLGEGAAGGTAGGEGVHASSVDAVFHAAVVAARLHHVLRQLIERRALDGAELARAKELSGRTLRRFAQCNDELGDDARFVEEGRAVLRETRQLMLGSVVRAA